MKKFFVFFLSITAFIVFIFACVFFANTIVESKQDSFSKSGFTVLSKDNNSDIDVLDYIDPETGVHYIIFRDYRKAGLSVRYNSDGSIMIEGVYND